jgi:hypothetical protein
MSETPSMGCCSQQLSAPERQVLSLNRGTRPYHRGSRFSFGRCCTLYSYRVVTAHPRGAAYESAVRVSRAAYETNVFHA